MLSRRPVYPAGVLLPVAVAAALTLSLYIPHSMALAFGSYRLDQRVNQVSQQPSTDSFASQNAIGQAFVSTALTGVQSSLNTGISTGAISWVLEMLDLGDVTGSNNGTFHIGFVNGTPASSGNTYDGTSDLDWWYAPDPVDLSAGVPTRQLTGAFTGGVLASSGAHIRIQWAFGQTWVLSTVVLDAHSGVSGAWTAAASYQPPGFPASENIDPSLHSMASMNTGQLKGNVSAASLEAELIPSAFVGSACNQNYAGTNTMLDLLVGGCTKLLVAEVKATQPDQSDPTATAAGAGAPYTFSENSSHVVTTCHDKTAATVTLATCLNAAAYSDYMTFTTDRVIGKTGQTITFTSSPPAPASPGGAYDVNATGGGSANPLTYAIDGSSTPGACSISILPNHVSFLAHGLCVVDANQAGNSNYLVAAQASQSITVTIPRESAIQSTPQAPGARTANPVNSSPTPGPRLDQGIPTSPTRAVEQPAKMEPYWLTARFTRLRL